MVVVMLLLLLCRCCCCWWRWRWRWSTHYYAIWPIVIQLLPSVARLTDVITLDAQIKRSSIAPHEIQRMQIVCTRDRIIKQRRSDGDQASRLYSKYRAVENLPPTVRRWPSIVAGSRENRRTAKNFPADCLCAKRWYKSCLRIRNVRIVCAW